MQAIASAGAIVATAGVARDPSVTPLLAAAHVTPIERRAALRGIREEMTVFEVPPESQGTLP